MDKDLIKLALGAVGVYVAYRVVTSGVAKAGAAVSSGYNAAVNWTSDLFTSWFGPDVTGNTSYHVVTFDDGQRHAIGAAMVNSSGQFDWTGFPPGSQASVTYQLGKDAAGNWVASPV